MKKKGSDTKVWKKLGGKGILTDVQIDHLNRYYGMAIRNDNVDRCQADT